MFGPQIVWLAAQLADSPTTQKRADLDSYCELWQFDELAIKFGDVRQVGQLPEVGVQGARLVE